MDKKTKYINKIKYDGIIEEELKNTLIETLIGINNPFYLDLYYSELDKFFYKKTQIIKKGLFDNYNQLNIIAEDINRLLKKQFLDNERLENSIEKENIENILIDNFY